MVQLPICEGNIRISQNLMKTLKNHISWMDYPFLSKFWMFIAKKYSTFNEFIFFSEYSVLLKMHLKYKKCWGYAGRCPPTPTRGTSPGPRKGAAWPLPYCRFYFGTPLSSLSIGPLSIIGLLDLWSIGIPPPAACPEGLCGWPFSHMISKAIYPWKYSFETFSCFRTLIVKADAF